jgi:regulatory protein
MLITAILPKAGHRSRVEIWLDGTQKVELARDTAKQLNLRPGEPIDQESLDRLVAADQRRLAMGIATTMLTRRPRSEREVRTALRRRKTSPDVIDEVVARLLSARLLDDAEFARSFTESRDRTSPRGRRLITQELVAQGVDRETARAATADVAEEDAAYRVATRRARTLTGADWKSFSSRIGGLLQRRGFGWDVTRTTVARCWAESQAEAPVESIQ